MSTSKILQEAREILLKVASLAAPDELPKTFVENNKRIWNSFHLGEKHQHLREEEVRRQLDEK